MRDICDPQAHAERIAESVKEQAEGEGNSRRQFLSRSALAGTALLALSGGTGFAMAQDDDNGPDEPTVDFDDVAGTDIDVLNYALTLENLENAFYREGLDTFDPGDFEDAEVVPDYGAEIDQSVYMMLETVGAHEAAHVEVLTETITLLGGDPGAEANYEFGVETVEDFIATAQVLENTGVAAYAGAAPFVESPDLQGVALSIHSVEARHAAFLNNINGESFFPDAFDSALSQQAVLDAAGSFIQSGNDEGGETDGDDGGNSDDGDS